MTNIVVIAHDAKKPQLANFLGKRLEWLRGVNLIATGRTAEFLESQGLPCKHMSPGQSGGYIQITEMLQKGDVDIVIFLRDHKLVQKHHEDIRNLLEACNVHNIPLATNYATAELVILGLIKKEAVERMQKKD